MDEPAVRVSFVCLGNICRSPTAEAVMAAKVAEAGLGHAISLDSAGTGGWHVGEPPDARASEAASRRGLAMSHLRGRQFRSSDFAELDLVLAMDRSNLDDLLRAAPDDDARAKVRLVRTFDPAASDRDPHGLDHEVPDPYYGGPDGFDVVLDLLEGACDGLLDHLRETHLGA